MAFPFIFLDIFLSVAVFECQGTLEVKFTLRFHEKLVAASSKARSVDASGQAGRIDSVSGSHTVARQRRDFSNGFGGGHSDGTVGDSAKRDRGVLELAAAAKAEYRV